MSPSRGDVGGGPPLSTGRMVALALGATALHLAFDAVAYGVPWARPPYLRLADAPEPFQTLSPVAVSVAFAVIGGIIALIAVAAVEPRQRRTAVLGSVVTAFWAFSATLLRVAWLTTPWPATAVAVLCGIPRGLAIGWVLTRLARASRISASRARAA